MTAIMTTIPFAIVAAVPLPATVTSI
jgi:hypothetical protein